MSEQMSEEFIDWINGNNDFNAIFSEDIDLMWTAWQASRQSLVVKLPEVKFWLGDKSLECIDDFKKQLDAAGVKYE